MAYWWIIQIAIAVALAVVAYSMVPQPKRQKPQAAQDLSEPTSEAGRPIPVLFGTMTISSPNVLEFMDKSKSEYEVAA